MKAIVINEKDNVATAITDIKKGEKFRYKEKVIEILEDILMGHKFALRDITEGEPIIKYGEIIGVAKKGIKAGEYVHIHNIKSRYQGVREVDIDE